MRLKLIQIATAQVDVAQRPVLYGLDADGQVWKLGSNGWVAVFMDAAS